MLLCLSNQNKHMRILLPTTGKIPLHVSQCGALRPIIADFHSFAHSPDNICSTSSVCCAQRKNKMWPIL